MLEKIDRNLQAISQIRDGMLHEVHEHGVGKYRTLTVACPLDSTASSATLATQRHLHVPESKNKSLQGISTRHSLELASA